MSDIGLFGTFGYADEAWMPTLLDIERFKAEGDPDQKAYFGQFGFDQLEIPDADVNIKARAEKLNIRFIARYGTRMIGQETMEIWQVRLQERFDAVSDKYERAYTLYEKYKDQMMNDALPGITTTVKGSVKGSGTDSTSNSGTDTNTMSGTDTTKATAKHSDTPDSAINTSDNFAGTLDKDDSSITYGKKDSRSISGTTSVNYGKVDTTDMETKQIYTGGTIMDGVNKTINGWRDIDTDFIAEFEDLFLNILWC